ncbi:DUF2855 family protein [Salinisphaera aquimarina]|uniref:DUF2855 family protein n=1 Tax=Salinisphaera aquimarina TaxID=2094031 RepID=A0ABV7EPH2_9GAMM
MFEFQIRKADIRQHRVIPIDAAADESGLTDGEVLVRVERFAFTANNITYATMADRLGYWQFFPPAGDDADGWGVIPVWGFACVIASRAGDIPVGDRLYGYFPPATCLIMKPVGIKPQRLIDGAAHRSQLPAAYNSYSRVAAEPGYDRAMDDERMLLWPLHITSFFLWDVLQDRQWHGARQVVIVSASSKTSIGLAYALNVDVDAPVAVGVTSASNLDFVENLGLYERTVAYDALTDIDADIPAVIVDMSGNVDVLGHLHAHLGENMRRCINVGLTHGSETGMGEGVIAERSEFFFAPSHIQKRVKEWGADDFGHRTSTFLRDATVATRDWLTLKTIDGLTGLAEVYPEVCAGRIPADQGLIVKL